MSQINSAKLPVQIALHSCRFLQVVLESGRIHSTGSGVIVQEMARKIHEFSILSFDFGQPLGLIERDGSESYDGLLVCIPTAATTLNDLAQSYNVRSPVTLISISTNAIIRI